MRYTLCSLGTASSFRVVAVFLPVDVQTVLHAEYACVLIAYLCATSCLVLSTYQAEEPSRSSAMLLVYTLPKHHRNRSYKHL